MGGNIVSILHIHGAWDNIYPFWNRQDNKSESPKMKIGVDVPIFTQNNIRGSMVQLYPYPKIWEQKIVEICYIDGAIAIFQLFCDHQGTESKSRKIKFCVAGTIFTHPNIRCPIVKRYAYSTRWWKNILAIVHIYGAWAISLLFCNHQDTESES